MFTLEVLSEQTDLRPLGAAVFQAPGWPLNVFRFFLPACANIRTFMRPQTCKILTLRAFDVATCLIGGPLPGK